MDREAGAQFLVWDIPNSLKILEPLAARLSTAQVGEGKYHHAPAVSCQSAAGQLPVSCVGT